MDDTTINGWIRRPGPIHLRHTRRRDVQPDQLRAAHGILLAVVSGAAVLVWAAVLLMAWLR